MKRVMLRVVILVILRFVAALHVGLLAMGVLLAVPQLEKCLILLFPALILFSAYRLYNGLRFGGFWVGVLFAGWTFLWGAFILGGGIGGWGVLPDFLIVWLPLAAVVATLCGGLAANQWEKKRGRKRWRTD